MIGLRIAALVFAALWLLLWRRARFAWIRSSGRPPERRPTGTVRTVRFAAIDGTSLEGWLFLPEGSTARQAAWLASALLGSSD